MALGARQATVLRLIVKQGMSLVVSGMTIGIAAALLVGRLLNRMLFGVGAGDLVSRIGAALVLSTVALVACYLPIRRATPLDPLAALRQS
jgi:putative ABC transport system permease protein